jgi:hypothetical protein
MKFQMIVKQSNILNSKDESNSNAYVYAKAKINFISMNVITMMILQLVL